MDAEFPADETVVFGDECDPTNGEPVTWMRAPEARPRARIDIEASRGIDAKAVLPNKMGTVKGNTQRCKQRCTRSENAKFADLCNNG